ncbi:MAG: TIGR03643 family protein, partial [Betaproteobacteria bacterium]|nr:TIGR03643 family protein [Betaproteobacteria bacterium]NDE26065.1 TIGR03643 family protein [Betaproteobacteria bacterium]
MSKFIASSTPLSPGDISAVIQMAWEDRTTFETIFERTGVTETGVIKIMRAELSASSFKMWRT